MGRGVFLAIPGSSPWHHTRESLVERKPDGEWMRSRACEHPHDLVDHHVRCGALPECSRFFAEGDVQRQWLLAGLACDCADALAAIAGGRGGYLPKRTSAIMTGMALAAAVLGVAVLREQ